MDRVEIPDEDTYHNDGIDGETGDIKTVPVKYDSIYEVVKKEKGLFPKIGAWIKDTTAGRNTVGRVAGIGLDIAGFFVPKLDGIRRKGKRVLHLDERKFKYQPTSNNMNLIKKALSIQGIKEFFNFKDKDGNFSWEQVGISLLQVAIFILLAWLDSQFGFGLVNALTG